ncbi:MAG: nucleotidyltransferase [Bradymonadaceae bacterium]
MATFDPALFEDFPVKTAEFYRQVMLDFQKAGLEFLVGGAFALGQYAGIFRHTKDLDLFVREEDVDEMIEVLLTGGYEAKVLSSTWLAKASCGEDFIDLIFNSGNGLSPVDDTWFARASRVDVIGVQAQVCPVEEVIWTKAYLMERERFDGADVAHIIHQQAENLEWERLIELFGPHWRVLLSHVVLFGFIYPSERDRIPRSVMIELLDRLVEEEGRGSEATNICRGTLLSRHQYMVDVEAWGYADARVEPHGEMTQQQAVCLSMPD